MKKIKVEKLENFSFFLNNKIGGDNITFQYRYRKQIIIGITIFIIIISITTVGIYQLQTKKKNKKAEIIIEKKSFSKTTEKEEIEKQYKVDIKGQINSPGIYSLNQNSRVIDVIELAGGLTENADTSVINLSKKVNDEMVIIIYSKEEVQDFKKTKEIENVVEEKCIQKDENSLINDACINTENKVSKKISINSSTLEELMTLPGIGESKAKDIIEYREKNGPFEKIEDLAKVNGIGENTLAQIKEDITL